MKYRLEDEGVVRLKLEHDEDGKVVLKAYDSGGEDWNILWLNTDGEIELAMGVPALLGFRLDEDACVECYMED